MRLIDNWKAVLTRAWSVRLMILAALLSGAETALSVLDAATLGLPAGVFSALVCAVTAVAVLVRLIAQPDMYDDK